MNLIVSVSHTEEHSSIRYMPGGCIYRCWSSHSLTLFQSNKIHWALIIFQATNSCLLSLLNTLQFSYIVHKNVSAKLSMLFQEQSYHMLCSNYISYNQSTLPFAHLRITSLFRNHTSQKSSLQLHSHQYFNKKLQKILNNSHTCANILQQNPGCCLSDKLDNQQLTHYTISWIPFNTIAHFSWHFLMRTCRRLWDETNFSDIPYRYFFGSTGKSKLA